MSYSKNSYEKENVGLQVLIVSFVVVLLMIAGWEIKSRVDSTIPKPYRTFVTYIGE